MGTGEERGRQGRSDDDGRREGGMTVTGEERGGHDGYGGGERGTGEERRE